MKMPYSVKANKITTLELDLQDLRSLLAERSHAILGEVENGFDRRVEIEPLFVVEHGEASLTGVRVIVTDTLGENDGGIRSISAGGR
jgi:hypothetical protein